MRVIKCFYLSSRPSFHTRLPLTEYVCVFLTSHLSSERNAIRLSRQRGSSGRILISFHNYYTRFGLVTATKSYISLAYYKLTLFQLVKRRYFRQAAAAGEWVSERARNAVPILLSAAALYVLKTWVGSRACLSLSLSVSLLTIKHIGRSQPCPSHKVLPLGRAKENSLVRILRLSHRSRGAVIRRSLSLAHT